MKGHINIQHTVWCACCEKWDMTSGPKKVCILEFRRMGWRKVHGLWRCPKHINAVQDAIGAAIASTPNLAALA